MSASRYILLEPLGTDGAWVRYRAVHRVHGTFHLARVRTGLPPGAVERLTPLVHLQRANRHPGLVPLEHLVRTGPTITAVAPWVDAAPLAAVLPTIDLLPAEAAWVLGEVGAIVAVAHGWGLPHGALSPDHVLLQRAGDVLTVRVDGFGLAIADRAALSVEEDRAALTALAEALGAPKAAPVHAEPGASAPPWSPALLARVAAGAAGLAMDAGVSMHSFLPDEPAAPEPERWWRRLIR